MSNIVMAGAISEGVMTMLVGWLMSIIHINMLFYYITILAVIMLLNHIYCNTLIAEQKESLQ